MIDWISLNLTLIIAIYGASLSTIITITKIYYILKDKAKIKVTAKFGFITGLPEMSENLLIITAINKGRRSVTLSSFGIRTKDKQNIINPHRTNLPFELEGGKAHCEWFEASKLKSKNCKFAWYRDQTGKLYKSKNIGKKLKRYFSSENK